jgi:hypothetical protein
MFNAHLPPGWETYRTYALHWSGQPTHPPAVAAARSGASTAIVAYASWNGASAVASWRVLAGASPTSLEAVGSASKTGFETAIALPASVSGPYVAVQALDASGAVIGVSATVKSSGSA